MIKIRSTSKGLATVVKFLCGKKTRKLVFSYELELIDDEVLDASLYRQFADELEEKATDFIKQLKADADLLSRPSSKGTPNED